MICAILLSGGTGTRLGYDIPKQYLKVNGKMILEYSIETLLNSKYIDLLCIVADSRWYKTITKVIKSQKSSSKFVSFTSPGKTRQLSIYNGLKALKGLANNNDYVLIHDAARPMLKDSLIQDIVNHSHDYDGVLPALPMKDTVYMVDDSGQIQSLLKRSNVIAGQSPELFLFDKYLKANEKLIHENRIMEINGSTEPAYLAGMNIITIQGDENNFKITTKEDLCRFTDLQESG